MMHGPINIRFWGIIKFQCLFLPAVPCFSSLDLLKPL